MKVKQSFVVYTVYSFLEGNCEAKPDISPPFDVWLPGSTRVQLSFFDSWQKYVSSRNYEQ